MTARITVPRRVEAISNGRLVKRSRHGRWSTWSWVEDDPMATYLATATTGHFRLDRSTVAGMPSVVAVDPRPAQWYGAGACARPRPDDRLFELLFGPYPFDDAGGVVDDAARVGYALETQTRPIFDGTPTNARRPRARPPVVRRQRLRSRAGPRSGSTRASPPGRPGAGRRPAGRPTTAEAIHGVARTPAARRGLGPAARSFPGLRSSSRTRCTFAARWRLRRFARWSERPSSTRPCGPGRPGRLRQRRHRGLHRPCRGRVGPPARRPLSPTCLFEPGKPYPTRPRRRTAQATSRR